MTVFLLYVLVRHIKFAADNLYLFFSIDIRFVFPRESSASHMNHLLADDSHGKQMIHMEYQLLFLCFITVGLFDLIDSLCDGTLFN